MITTYAHSSIHEHEHGQIHGNPVAGDWAGVVMRKQLGIQRCDRGSDQLTNLPTDRAEKVSKSKEVDYTSCQSQT